MTATLDALRPAPTVTPEQIALETKARELWEHPRVKAAFGKAKALMLAGYGVDVPDEARRRFDQAMAEYGFSYVERVLCRDRNNFCVHYTCHPPYTRSDGSHVPGCRFYGENPDCVYRWGGLHDDRSYRLTCTPAGPLPREASFTLMGTYGGTTPGASVDLHELTPGPDGRYVITIDARPAGGRANHLQMTPGVRLLLIREFLVDWAAETPLAMTLEADGVVRGGAWDDEAALQDICYFLVEELYLYFWMNHIYRNLEPNTVKGPAPAAAMGGNASMATCQGFFRLEADEAVVLDWDPADAMLSSVSACDWWFQPIEEHRLQSSLATGAAAPNADGTITAVLAASDPGVANWVDTNGLRQVLLTGRWQGLPAQPPRQGPRLSARLVKRSELAASLPQGMALCSEAERRQRYAARRAAYARRTGDLHACFEDFD
jgi:hypothetical protein